MADDKTENEAVSFGTSSSRPTHTDVDIEVELTEVAAAIEPSENEGDSPDSGWKLGQFQESLGYDVVQTVSVDVLDEIWWQGDWVTI